MQLCIGRRVSLTSPIHSGYHAEEGSILSLDGVCRPFDKKANGTYFSDGAGVVLLMPLSQARRLGKKVYAVIEGVGLNNDGIEKSSFSGPSARGQEDCIRRALIDASIEPTQIHFHECHGTATPVGDPIEVRALRNIHKSHQNEIILGSIKGNFGHLTAAAGVAGIIKSALAMYHGIFPGTCHFQEENPLLELAQSNFRVHGQSIKLQGDVLRAGISSFGVGGTNAHTILRSGDRWQDHDGAIAVSELSFSEKEDLNQLQKSLQPFSKIDSAAYPTLENRGEEKGVAIWDQDTVSLIPTPGLDHRGVAFLFPGQGSQYIDMGKDLYQCWPIFAKNFDRCSKLALENHGVNLEDIISSSQEEISQTKKHPADHFFCVFRNC